MSHMTEKVTHDVDSFLPLSAPVYHVLVTLGDGEKHGYAMMQEIAERTEGQVELLPGTLYSTIKRMLADRLIESCAPPEGEGTVDDRRRYYGITRLGKKVAGAETERLAMLVRLARQKGFASAR